MTITIYYQDGSEQIVEDASVRLYLEACRQSPKIPWKPGVGVLGASLYLGRALVAVNVLAFEPQIVTYDFERELAQVS